MFCLKREKGCISNYYLVTEISCKIHSTQTPAVTTPVPATSPSVSDAERGCDELPLRSGATCAPTTRLLLFEHLPSVVALGWPGAAARLGQVGPGRSRAMGKLMVPGARPAWRERGPAAAGSPATPPHTHTPPRSRDRRDAAAAAVSIIMENTSRRSAGPADAAAGPVRTPDQPVLAFFNPFKQNYIPGFKCSYPGVSSTSVWLFMPI